MSVAEQERTGVYNLTVPQRLELEKWLNQYFVPKTQAQMPTGSNPLPSPEGETRPSNLTFDLIIDGGRYVQLSDGTLWEIAPEDRKKTSLWLVSFPIEINDSGSLDYPKLLIDQNTKDAVRAKQVQKTTS